ncbi:MAG: hypothetical protein ACXV8M_04150, partial [Candidatus Angelobacter sp.]
LNLRGVSAMNRNDRKTARDNFQQAYKLDPRNSFAINNMGYLAELEGSLERAQRYYDQAKANTSEAVIDRSTAEEAQGKTVASVAGHTAEGPMKVNELNSEALGLLNRDRAPEADVVLQTALKLDPNNPFTLNNMGFAKEKEGELESAIRYYDSSAATGSREPIVIAFNKSWRGKPISEVAAQNADKSRKELSKAQDMQARVARLNLRGVSAMNRNDRKTARDNFQQAYKLDPRNSFAINNMGYLAELEGDTETAQSYYEQAQRAERARQKVMVSTRPEVEGQTVGHVAEQSSTLVESSFVARAEARRRSGAPPALKTRDNRTVEEPKTRPPSTNTTPPEFRRPPQEDENQAVPAPQSDQPPADPTPANQAPETNEPQLKTRPAQQPADTQPPADSQQQNAPQQQNNSKPPLN